MKHNRFFRTLVRLTAAGVLIFSTLAATVPAVSAEGGDRVPSTIQVPADYSTIQAAVDAASPGDTVLVSGGPYIENVVVDKELVIKGVGMPQVDAFDEYSPVFTLTADEVSIVELEITGGSDAITTGTTDRHMIDGNVITGNGFGVYLGQWDGGSDNNCIQFNYFTMNYSAIEIYEGGTGNKIHQNKFEVNTDFDIVLGPFNNGANEIHHNNFVEGGKCFEDTDDTMPGYIGPNRWYDDISEQGNFWGDYAGVDADSDGIGDTPYDIYDTSLTEVTNQDIYPVTTVIPDLVITEKYETWVDEGQGIYQVHFTVTNLGTAEADEFHDVGISIDGTEVQQIEVPFSMMPGESYSASSGDITMTGESDNITVCADVNQEVDEQDELNNCMSNMWGSPMPGVVVDINGPDIVGPDADYLFPVDIGFVQDLNAVQYDILFDHTILELDAITGGLLDGTPFPVPTGEIAPRELAPGHWRVVQILELGSISGAGHLSELHFHVIGEVGDDCCINLAEGVLSGFGGEIPATWLGHCVDVATTVLPGDANDDGIVNVLDMTKVARIILELDPETPGADANQDGTVNVLDMTKIARLILELD